MWPKVKLGELINPVSETYRGVDDEVVLINTSDVSEGKITNHNFVENRNLPGQFKKTFKKNDILFSEIRPANKRFALVTQEDCTKYIASTKLMVLRKFSDEADLRFVYYILTADETLADLQHLAESRSGTFPQITFDTELRNRTISLPPLPVQQKIADILGAYDDLIENNRRRIELLEKMARELYRERFVRRRGEGAELTLLEVFDFVRGKSYASNEIDVVEGVPMVNLKNIRAWGGYNSGAERLFSGDFKEEQTLGRGDVIMGVTDMTQDRRIVGHVALVPTLDQTATFSMDIIKLIPKDMSNVELYSILQYSGVSQAISQLATGATVLHLRPGALDSVRLWIPRK